MFVFSQCAAHKSRFFVLISLPTTPYTVSCYFMTLRGSSNRVMNCLLRWNMHVNGAKKLTVGLVNSAGFRTGFLLFFCPGKPMVHTKRKHHDTVHTSRRNVAAHTRKRAFPPLRRQKLFQKRKSQCDCDNACTVYCLSSCFEHYRMRRRSVRRQHVQAVVSLRGRATRRPPRRRAERH